jgi:hypothetical protein
MPSKAIYFLLTLELISICCNRPPDKTSEAKMEQQLFGDTRFFNQYFRSKQASLELSDLQNGFDSLQLRVWFYSTFSDSADVFVIKKEPHQNWSACKIRFPIEADSAHFGYEKVNNPRGEEIWSKLNQSGINAFKGQDIEAMKRYCDGEIAVFEMATKSSYRLCSSHSSMAYFSGREPEEEKQATAYVSYLISLWRPQQQR